MVPADPNAPMPKSIWAATAPKPIDAPALEGDLDVDVVVVGGGITGLSTALHLRPGASVAVLEANELGFGASGRNNGLAIPTLTRPDPDDLVREFGPDTGERAVALVRDSAALVFDLIRRHDMELAGEQTGWIQPVHTPGRMKIAERRVRQWSARGARVELLSRDRLASMIGSEAWHGGWMAHDGGTIHPLAYVRGLAKAAAGLGASIHTHSPATGIERAGDRWRVSTPRGSVTAGQVVLATNAYSDDLWPGLRRTIVPIWSYQCATAPLSDNVRKSVLPGRHALSDTRGDLHFCRYDWDGRLISGAGLVVPFGYEGRVRERITARLARLFPQLGEVAIHEVWRGYVGMTPDWLPRLHILAPGVVAWIGCNGRGVALATAMGPVLADMVRGRPAAELPLPVTEPRPIPLHGMVQRLASSFMLMKRWQDAKEV